MTSTASRSPRAGRPRAISDTTPELSAREQILNAAAELFVKQGIGSTSTRAIAQAVGIRQASMYYHFAGKDDILAELLAASVRPSLEFSQRLLVDARDETSAAAALYALAIVDVATLMNDRHNIGTLYLSPEVQEPRFDMFRAERGKLEAAYGRLGCFAGGNVAGLGLSEELLGSFLIHLVEVVIQLRRDGKAALVDVHTVAMCCLRLVGLTDEAVREAEAAGQLLVADHRRRQ